MSEMSNPEWRNVTLGQLGEVNRGRSRTRPRNAEHLYGGPYPFVQTGDVTASGGRISEHKQTYSQAGFEQSRLWPAETMCITIAANIAETGVLQFDACFPDSVVGFIADPTIADVYFVEYMFRTLKRQIQHEATGSVQDNINLATLARLQFSLPPLTEQKAIAEVLGALDGKIAANTQLSSSIEQLLALEVDANWLDDLKTGDRPELIPMVDIFEINPSNSKPTVDLPLYLEMKKLPERGSGISDWDYRPAKGGTRFQQGDSLMARITPCLENRKTGFVDFLEDGQVGIGSTEFIALRSRPGIPNELSYFLAVNSDFRDFAIRHMVGTSGRQRVSSSDIAAYYVPTPHSGWLRDFANRAETQFKFLKSLRDENRTLAATRDALLPQLMSGKLRVREFEKAVEAVV